MKGPSPCKIAVAALLSFVLTGSRAAAEDASRLLAAPSPTPTHSSPTPTHSSPTPTHSSPTPTHSSPTHSSPTPTHSSLHSDSVMMLAEPQPQGGGRITRETAEAPRNSLRVALSFATHVPLTVGGTVGLEILQGWFAELHLGWMPRAYADFVNDVASTLGLYDPAIGELLGASLSGSMVVRGSLGVRPFGDSGVELLAGYTRVSSGGSRTSTDVIQRATGNPLPPATENIPVEATTHALHLAVGLRWLLKEHWFLRGRVGYVHTFSASSEVRIPDRPGLSEQAEAVVTDTLTRYGFSPELQLGAGFRF